jgi:hypothetical protein
MATAPNPSGIGQFVIGLSPIGTQPFFSFTDTIISQYQNSPTLYQLIENFYSYLNPTKNVDEFYDLVWNVDTAVGWGLDVWGRIVGVGRVVQVPTEGLTYLGFSQSPEDPLITGFGQGPFYSAGSSATSNYTMDDDQYRLVILAKALANISDGATRGINQVLMSLFPGRGNCYVRDNLDMSLTYVFEFLLTPYEIATVVQSGVLPRPAGVSVGYEYPMS